VACNSLPLSLLLRDKKFKILAVYHQSPSQKRQLSLVLAAKIPPRKNQPPKDNHPLPVKFLRNTKTLSTI
jgi:hypothetical protein